MGKTFLLLLLAAAACTAGVVEKRLNYSISVRDDAGKVEIAAAEELKKYLARIYSAPIKLNGSSDPIVFHVGNAAATGDFKVPDGDGAPEGMAVMCRGRQVFLYGKDDADAAPYSYLGDNGSILSVFYFLRKYAGLQVYAPEEDKGESIVANKALQLPERDCPVFSFRVRGIGRSFPDYSSAMMNRYARKQLCNIPHWAHSDYYYQCINRWNKRFKDRPELFGIYDGVRCNESYPKHIPCLSNPEVKKIIVEDIKSGIAKRKRPVHTLRIFCDAPFRRCECENCTVAATNEDYFYGFIIDVYREVAKTYPGLNLFLQEKSPSHIHPPSEKWSIEGVAVDLTTGLPGVVDYSKRRGLYESWAARGARPMVRIYPRLPKWDSYPIINPHAQANCLKALQGVCWGQRDSDSARPGARFKRRTPYAFAALTNYVYTNILLDVNKSVDELMAEFCRFMYPGASEEMLAFYACMEKIYNSCNVNEDPLLSCYVLDKLAEPAALLEKAAVRCTDKYWMKKMQDAFVEFMGHSRQMLEENAQFIELRDDADKRRKAFRKKYPSDMVLDITGKWTNVELCPVNVLSMKFQETDVGLIVRNGMFVIKLEANEAHMDRIVRNAMPCGKGNVWADDSFEIMLTPGVTGRPYVQLIVNSNGALQALRYDGKVRRASNYAGADRIAVKAAEIAGGWKVELAIPIEVMREFCPEDRGAIGIFRTNRYKPGADGKVNYPTVSAFTDSLPQGNYHNQSVYRAFTFKAE